MKKAVFLLLLVLLNLSILIGCKDEDLSEQNYVLTIAMPKITNYQSRNLNNNQKQLLSFMYKGLVDVKDEKIELAIAEDIVEKPDNRYYIRLKKTFWSDNTPLIVEDFLRSWQREENYFYNINLLYFEAGIKNVTRVDDYSMIIELSKSDDEFLKKLSMVEFYPLKEENDELIYNDLVVNGAFKVKDISSKEIILEENDRYFDKEKIFVDEINILFSNDYNKLLNMYKNGDIDILKSIADYDIYNALKNEKDLHIGKMIGIKSLVINPNSYKIEGINSREILNYGLDRAAINPLYNCVPESNAYIFGDISLIKDEFKLQRETDFYIKKIKKNQRTINDVKIKELIKTNPSVLNYKVSGLRLVSRDNINDTDKAYIISKILFESLGIVVDVEIKDEKSYLDAVDELNYDLLLSDFNYDSDREHGLIRTFLKNDSFDEAFYDKQEMKDIIKLYNDDYDIKTYLDFVKKIYDDNYFIPLYYLYNSYYIDSDKFSFTKNYQDLINISEFIINN